MRGRRGSLLLHRDGLPPSTFAGLPAHPPTHDHMPTGHIFSTGQLRDFAISVINGVSQRIKTINCE